MSARTLAWVGLIGAGVYILWRQFGSSSPFDFSNLDLSFITDPLQLPDVSEAGGSATNSYYDKLAAAENLSGDPTAKNPVSSASGLWQFVKGTWTKLGGAWGSDPSKAFGGLTPSVEEQNAMIGKLTNQNAVGLSNAGIAVTDATLYAAHLLGLPTAIKVLTAPASASLAAIAGTQAVSANRLPSTVGGFYDWLQGKMG